MGYPKYKYHSEKEPVVIQNEEQEERLGDEWKDSPADHGIITQPSIEDQFDIDSKLKKGSSPSEIDLSKLKKGELIAHIEENHPDSGIDTTLNKPELIAAIEEAR